MKIEQLKPSPKQNVLFKLASFKLVPSLAGCYALTTFGRDILYIGLSENLSIRLKQHLDNPKKTGVTIKGKAVWFYFIPFDKSNLPKLERTWLNQYSAMHGKRPVLNKIDSPV